MRARQTHIWDEDRRADGNSEWPSTGYSTTLMGEPSALSRRKRSRRRGSPWTLFAYGLISVCGAFAVAGLVMQALARLTH